MKDKHAILRHTDKTVLVSGHYKTDEKLVLRKKYNTFFEPKTDIVKDVIEFVFSVSPKKVLDVGCGNGDFLIKLRKAGLVKVSKTKKHNNGHKYALNFKKIEIADNLQVKLFLT